MRFIQIALLIHCVPVLMNMNYVFFLGLTNQGYNLYASNYPACGALPAGCTRAEEGALCCGQFVFQDHVAPVLQAAQKHVYGNV